MHSGKRDALGQTALQRSNDCPILRNVLGLSRNGKGEAFQPDLALLESGKLFQGEAQAGEPRIRGGNAPRRAHAVRHLQTRQGSRGHAHDDLPGGAVRDVAVKAKPVATARGIPEKGLDPGRQARVVVDMAHAPQLAQDRLGLGRLVLHARATGEHDVAPTEVHIRPTCAASDQRLPGALGEVPLDRAALKMHRRHAHTDERDHTPQPAPPIASHNLDWLPVFDAFCAGNTPAS